MVTIRNISGVAFLATVIFVVFLDWMIPESFLPSSVSPYQFNWAIPEFPWMQWVAIVVLMLLGIVFGCLFRQIRTRREPIVIHEEVRVMWTSSSFWSALFASPLVFGGVFSYIGENPGDGAAAFLAFHNGFFCEAVFSTLNKPGTEH